jgi:two-component system, OmpR family, sensor kinase
VKPAAPERPGLSLRATLLLAFAYVLLLVIIVLEVPLILNTSKRVDAEVKSDALSQSQLIAANVNDDLDNRPALQSIVERAARQLGGRVIVLDAEGILIADSAGSGLLGSSYASRPEIETALGGDVSQGTRDSASLDQSLLYSAVPVVHNRAPAGAVRVTQSVDAVQSEIRGDVFALIGVGAVALLLGIGVAWLVAGSLARPPRELARTARRVTAGDLEARAPQGGPREQREVAEAFNEMTTRLAALLESQRDFVANASHQLRTPLTGLRLRIEAASDLSQSDAVRSELDEAERELERLTGLLTNLLALARGDEQAPDARAVSLAQVARAAYERWVSRAEGRSSRLTVESEPAVEVLSAGEDLGIILDNLIENGISYSPGGSAITISTGARGPYGFVAVDDEGPGLDPVEAERVLERFYRGNASAGRAGTGLGLAIVRVLAERWGGHVELVNLPSGGLRAIAYLPLAAGGETLPNVDQGVASPLPTSG